MLIFSIHSNSLGVAVLFAALIFDGYDEMTRQITKSNTLNLWGHIIHQQLFNSL